MNHFFVQPDAVSLEADGNSGFVFLTGGDVNHIQNVLRMKSGEELLLSNGEGEDFHCVIERFEEERIVCRIVDRMASLTEPSLKITLFQALPKADKMELIIQKAVELGVFSICPVETSRSVVKYDEKKQKNKRERWQKIAESAAKQSRRGIIPEVMPICRFSDALKKAGEEDRILIPYENFKDMKATKTILSEIRPDAHIGIFIGPEGGFAEEEVAQAIKAGAEPISLGRRILRTETAPLMLLSVLLFQMET